MQSGIFWCLFYEQTLIGTVALRTIDDENKIVELKRMFVLPEYQGKGIGKELVRRCKEIYPDSEWLVQTTADKADFYKHIGFEVNNDVFLSIPCKLF